MERGLPVNPVSVDPFPFSRPFASVCIARGLLSSISLCQNVDVYSEDLRFKYLCKTCKSGYTGTV